MILGHRSLSLAGLLTVVLLSCRESRESRGDSARGSLPAVLPSSPASTTNWDVEAGPVMLVWTGNGTDSAAVILPDVTDSTIAAVQGNSAPITGLVFELFGKGGKVEGLTSAAPFDWQRRSSAVMPGLSPDCM